MNGLVTKEALGGITATIMLLAYVPYFLDVLKRRTKPHPYSWLLWTILLATSFTAQILEMGGAGAWITGTSCFACFCILMLSFRNGGTLPTRSDKLCLGSAFFAILLWFLTEDPTWSVIWVCITDVLAMWPTFRKTYLRPFEETLSLYVLSVINFSISIFALESYSLTTWLYPTTTVVTNLVFIPMVLFRRMQVNSTHRMATES